MYQKPDREEGQLRHLNSQRSRAPDDLALTDGRASDTKKGGPQSPPSNITDH